MSPALSFNKPPILDFAKFPNPFLEKPPKPFDLFSSCSLSSPFFSSF